jgi:hypothetical protein
MRSADVNTSGLSSITLPFVPFTTPRSIPIAVDAANLLLTSAMHIY